MKKKAVFDKKNATTQEPMDLTYIIKEVLRNFDNESAFLIPRVPSK